MEGGSQDPERHPVGLIFPERKGQQQGDSKQSTAWRTQA